MVSKMCMNYILVVILFISCFVENLGVNSPQMTFFSPASHEAVIHLESKYGNSATLKLSTEKHVASTSVSDSVGYSNSKVSTREGNFSEFLILGPDYTQHGVSAIIQEMNLRTSEDDRGCRDYVQFSVNSSETERGNKICGKLSQDDNRNVTDPRLLRSFFSPSGIIHLYFHSDYSADDEAANSSDSNASDREIGIEIVFTSYTVCPNPANSWKKLKPCSKTEKMSCIYSTLFCDSKVDCGFPGEYGVDEEGCYIPYIYMFVSIFGGIFVTASLIYIFVKWVTKVPKEYQ